MKVIFTGLILYCIAFFTFKDDVSLHYVVYVFFRLDRFGTEIQFQNSADGKSLPLG